MATPLKVLCSASKLISLPIKSQNAYIPVRKLLSSAYNCTEAWNKTIESSKFGDMSLSEFAVQIHEQLDKEGRISHVDMNFFAHHLSELNEDEEEAEFAENIFKRFNKCQESFPPCPAINHALVRGYVAAGLAHRLPPLLSDRLTYGLFPNYYSLNFLLNHFIVNKDFAHAVDVAQLSTIQEDFSNPLNVLLSLQACVQYLSGISLDDIAPPPKEASDGEEDWIKVLYIDWPHYDDHFDITDRRFLLGKTLVMLSQATCVEIPKDIHSNLKVIGLGIYHKFDQGLAFLQDILNSPTNDDETRTVSSQSLTYFQNRLESADTRDKDEPEIEIGLRTKDDIVRKLRPTPEEKENLLSEFNRLKDQLASQGKIVEDFSIEESVRQFVTLNIHQYEEALIVEQTANFKTWIDARHAVLEKQIYELKKGERIEEMKQQIRELQDQEELLNYFEQEEEIRLTFVDEDLKEADPQLSISQLTFVDEDLKEADPQLSISQPQ